MCNVKVSNAVLTMEIDKTGGVQELLGDGGLARTGYQSLRERRRTRHDGRGRMIKN